jgi:hypothetical protein
MLEDEKGAEGVAKRKHTAQSRTGPSLPVSCPSLQAGRKYLSSSEEQAVVDTAGLLSKSSQCITEKKQGALLPSTGSFLLASYLQEYFQKPEDKLRHLLLGQSVY